MKCSRKTDYIGYLHKQSLFMKDLQFGNCRITHVVVSLKEVVLYYKIDIISFDDLLLHNLTNK